MTQKGHVHLKKGHILAFSKMGGGGGGRHSAPVPPVPRPLNIGSLYCPYRYHIRILYVRFLYVDIVSIYR
jgi:hypothetical protein